MIELNDHGSAFIQSAKPSGRHKIMAHEVKHLPRLILYRPIIVGSFKVRLAVDFTIFFCDQQWHQKHSRRLLRSLLRRRRSSSLSCWSLCCSWYRIRHWSCRGRRSCRFWQWCSRARCRRSPPVICSPPLSLVSTPPIPALPIGLSSRTA